MSLDHDLYVIDPSNQDTNMHQLRDCLKDAIYELAERTASLSERLNKLENEAAATDNNALSEEPLIKDEKICKVFRDWCVVNGLDDGTFRYENNGILRSTVDGNYSIWFVQLALHVRLQEGIEYTLTELCGEEEE